MNQTKNSAKSGASGNRKAVSPAGKISATSVAASEPKKQKLPLWVEWNENDINSEKWEVGGKVKDSKAKPASAPVTHGFEDPDPKFEWPLSIQTRIDSYKRPSDIFEKTPVIVDLDSGLENFDLITPNEHLHNSETLRWIISQIHSLWDMCKKDVKSATFLANSPAEFDINSNKALASGRLWRPWEHIYAINKVVKGPFIPAYNPYGKYAVRLYFMGAWRKIVVDDLIPIDEKGDLLLPTTAIQGEIWPILLTKALLKIISLDFNPSDSATEFNDVNVISCLTGWLPEPLPLRFGHMSEVWKFLKETLPKYQWPDDKNRTQLDDDQTIIAESSEMKDETVGDNRSDGKMVKKPKETKATIGKDPKAQHKKDQKDKKGKSIIEEPTQDENFVPDFPEMVVFASFTDLPLNKLSASTEVADRRERLRKYNLNHDFSNPVWITCTRDVPLNPPPPPEKIPVWKTIRQKKKHLVPSDEPIVAVPVKPDQWVELKSPFCGYKASSNVNVIPTNRSNSRFGRLRSRPQTAIQGIEERDENKLESFISDSQSDLKANASESGDQSKSKLNSKLTVDTLNKSVLSTSKKENSFDGRDIGKNGPPSVSSMSKVGSTAKLEDDQAKLMKMSKATKKPTNVGPDSTSLINAPNPLVSNASLNGLDQNSNGDNRNSVENEQKSSEFKNKLWMDFDDFFICFKSIIVYHKPSFFKFNEKLSDLRQLMPQHKVEKKKDTTASLQTVPLPDEKSPKLLFVDSLSPIELIVSFASLSRWYETKLDLPEKLGKISKKGDIEHDMMSVTENSLREISPLQSGSLMAEPYSWKSLITGQPVLRIHTTATRSSFLSLPPGRHVLKFMISAPVGYHIHIVSNTKFNFGDEEDIMPKLTDESCRFIDQALHITKCLNEAIKNFSESQKQKETIDLLYTSISPLTDAYLNEGSARKDLTIRNLYDTFQNSLYEMLRKSLGDIADGDMAFAWKVFMNDCTALDLFNLKERRPETSSTTRGSAKKIEKKSAKEGGKLDKSEKQSTVQSITAATIEKADNLPDERLEYWRNHLASPEELIASVKIQSAWRGFYVRKIQQARIPGSAKNQQVTEALKKSWTIVEQNLQENALFLFRTMFKLNPNIMQYYPFYKDEWNRISYVDYNGSYLEQVGNSWFILFRDVFFAHEQILLLPKIYSNLNNCLLKVINNDTYKEIPKVFNKVSPYTYSKNKRGYTIIAEARISDQPVGAGRWRLRLIGSSSALLAPRANKPEIISSFDIRDTRDYYIPNDNKVIMRYKVVVSDDHLTTLQLTTSKPDVYIKFTIYDNGEEILSVTGKGTAVIPAFIFMKDRDINENGQLQSRPGSKTFSTGRASKAITNTTSETKIKDSKNKRSSSANSNDVKLDTKLGHSRSSSRQSLAGEIEEEEPSKQNHRYILEAVVLKNSWPLSPSQWSFVNTLKESEAADLKVFSKDRVPSPTKENKSVNSESKGAVLKAAKAKAQKSKTNLPGQTSSLSRPASSAFDITKPHWTLKWVSDASSSDNIEIKKDTDRIEEIKALKRAWESHETGRSIKAMASRSRFLKENLIKVDGGSITDEELDKQTEDQNEQQQQQTTISNNQSNLSLAQKQSDQKLKKTEEKSQKNTKSKKDVKTDNKIENLPQLENLPEILANDELFSNRPPTPPKAKIILPPLDVEPFVRQAYYGLRLKDENFEKEQDNLRKKEFESFVSFKEQMNKFREEERKYRLQQKIKQIEECEILQSKLDAARMEVYEPREAFRQVFLDAERKRLEDMANQEAILASQQKVDTKKKGSAGKAKKKK
ncbi:unnamed protein product [Brachionus calyciflorus]|uniref:Androglobin n=1 Tax=Brachionus calyciflorus TaxID=104777 RepID=A0A813R7A8_9BILA|nr:unnamed protein product [Brachionus calyciflorus]